MRASPILLLLASAACGASAPAAQQGAAASKASARPPFSVTAMATFREPWAMTFVPGSPFSLITEKGGRLLLREEGGLIRPVAGVPRVAVGGQGGLGDVVLHPQFAENGFVYLSYVEAGRGGKGAAVGRGKLDMAAPGGPRLGGFRVLWRQEPKVSGDGHFGHRIAFGPDGMMYISSGERQKFTPAQDPNQNLGKIVRLTDTGMIPSDNPFYNQGRVRAQIWSLGQRNPLGIAFDTSGRLWESEMGPRGGDEINLIERGRNYGYPIVSNGDHYDGREIPDHPTRPEFAAPKVWWTPSISPSSLMIYGGDMFPQWKGSAFVGALSGESLIRVALNGTRATKADQWPMNRIREVEEGPDGAIYLLEDGDAGRLLRLSARR